MGWASDQNDKRKKATKKVVGAAEDALKASIAITGATFGITSGSTSVGGNPVPINPYKASDKLPTIFKTREEDHVSDAQRKKMNRRADSRTDQRTHQTGRASTILGTGESIGKAPEAMANRMDLRKMEGKLPKKTVITDEVDQQATGVARKAAQDRKKKVARAAGARMRRIQR